MHCIVPILLDQIYLSKIYLIKDDEIAAQLSSTCCQVSKAQSQSQSNSPPLTATELSDGPLLQSTFALHMHALHRPAPHFFANPAIILVPPKCHCICYSCCRPGFTHVSAAVLLPALLCCSSSWGVIMGCRACLATSRVTF